MSMKFTRKGFFKSIFGGFVAAAATPSLIKAEENIQPSKDFSLNNGNLGIGGSDNIGLGTSMPITKLHVHGIIFHVHDRTLEMSGNEKGDFEVKWLDVKENESSACITIKKPTTDPFKAQLKNDIR
jgi:hypothetical protein